MLFDRGGRIVSTAQQEFPQLFPQPGHVEHDPEEIWRSQLETAREALAARRRRRPADMAAIGVTNQRETTVLWERATGRPVANAIVWQSRITAPLCDRLKAAGHEPRRPRQDRPGARRLLLRPRRSSTCSTPPTACGRGRPAARCSSARSTRSCIWRLTGGRVHVTDESNASRTLLYNIHTRDWDDELLALFDVPRAMLPEVRVEQRGLRRDRRRSARRRDPDRRHRRRPAGGALRPGLLRARHRQEHLRHRLLHAAQHRRPAGLVDTRAC